MYAVGYDFVAGRDSCQDFDALAVVASRGYLLASVYVVVDAQVDIIDAAFFDKCFFGYGYGFGFFFGEEEYFGVCAG